MDLRKLKKLIDLVQESGIAELEVTEGEEKVRIVKHPGAIPAQAVMHPAAHAVAAPIPAAGAAAPQPAAPAEPEGHLVKAPMVGTFYRSSSPGAEPYVKEGDEVEEGQTLCIIEVMKLFNEIRSPAAGTVKRICVENGAGVEFEEVLMEIEPRGG